MTLKLISCSSASRSRFWGMHLYFVEQLSVLVSLGPHLLLQVVLPDLVHLEHLEVGDSCGQDSALVVLDVFCKLVEPAQKRTERENPPPVTGDQLLGCLDQNRVSSWTLNLCIRFRMSYGTTLPMNFFYVLSGA